MLIHTLIGQGNVCESARWSDMQVSVSAYSMLYSTGCLFLMHRSVFTVYTTCSRPNHYEGHPAQPKPQKYLNLTHLVLLLYITYSIVILNALLILSNSLALRIFLSCPKPIGLIGQPTDRSMKYYCLKRRYMILSSSCFGPHRMSCRLHGMRK